jgi:hypothetical protein
MDRIAEAKKDPKWRQDAEKAYKNATKKVYTEWEKQAIREEYLRALAQYATFGSVPDNKDPGNPFLQ